MTHSRKIIVRTDLMVAALIILESSHFIFQLQPWPRLHTKLLIRGC